MIVFDDSCAPLFILIFEGPVRVQDLEVTLAQSLPAFDRGPYVGLSDLRRSERPSPKERAEVTAFLKSQNPAIERNQVASAQILTSRLMAGVLTAIGWVVTPAKPNRSTNSARDALAFLESHATRAGLRVPAHAAARLAELDNMAAKIRSA